MQPVPKMKFDEAEWTDRMRKLSARFQNYPSVLTSHVSVICQVETRYLVNTEGSRLQHGRGFARVVITRFRQGRRRHRPATPSTTSTPSILPAFPTIRR